MFINANTRRPARARRVFKLAEYFEMVLISRKINILKCGFPDLVTYMSVNHACNDGRYLVLYWTVANM